MVWTVLALALWVVLGGFISYYGDLQGRRWGKRRVSWFGLRPKHTAILITSLTGGFIALFSVASLMIIVPTVRDVVTHGENAIQENKRLIVAERQQQLVDKLNREKDEQAGRLKQQENDTKIADGVQKLADLRKQFSKAQASLAPLQAHLNELNAKVPALAAQAQKLVVSNKQLEAQNASAGFINDQISRQNVDLEHKNGLLDKTNHSLMVANESLLKINLELKRNRTALEETNDQFYKLNVNLDKTNDNLVNANANLENAKNALEKQVADLTHDRDEVIDLIRQRDQLLGELRQGHVILGAGVELGRISMDAHLRPEAIKKQVNSLMAAASEQAKKFGAADDEDGRAATLPLKPTPTLSGYENKSESAQLDSLAEDWSGSDKAYVVVATTVTNCLAGEPAYIVLRRFPVVRVYAKGAEVASRTIDGHSKVDDIITNLMIFLQKDVQKSALEAGIIPRVDPKTGLSEVGTLGQADLFRLTDTVRRMRGPVLLRARARQDVSSADRLSLTFQVSRLPAPPQTVATDN